MPQKRKNQNPHTNSRKRHHRSAGEGSGDVRNLDLSDPVALPKRAIDSVHNALGHAVTKGTTATFRALKKAKPNETQKILKRLKAARKKKEASVEMKLEGELAVVKSLGGKVLEKLAAAQVRKSCTKAAGKSRRESVLWPAEVMSVEDEGEGESVERKNVVARLYGFPVVRETVKGVVDEVRSILGVDAAQAAAKAKEEKEEEESAEAESKEGGEEGEGEEGEVEQEEFRGFSDSNGFEEEVADEPGEEEGDEQDPWDMLDAPDVFADFDVRLAASDDSEDEDGDGDVDAAVTRTDDEWSGGSDDDGLASDDDGGDEANERAPPPPPPPPPPPVLKKSKATSTIPSSEPPKKSSSKPAAAPDTITTPATSKLLPTLLHTGYISGSDSESERERNNSKGKAKKKGPPEKKERKNRMGQQARRALWEKKYGTNAKHVKKMRTEEKWREAQGGGPVKDGRRREVGGRAGDKKEERKPVEKDNEGSLHPSWEAARKAKEKNAVMSEALKKPVGKKITFD